ncbi:MAG: insulinase family protein [Betaproteobacteria bacterium]|nr:insulinase family protein [Betaproteobacteria bacterium]
MKKLLLACTALFVFLAAVPVIALEKIPPLPKGVSKITSVEGITQYRFANGLEVLLAPDPSKPQIVVNITYLVGSRHENYGETGMAHLLEHMLFKGSKKHPKITDEFTQRGAQWNASTSNDRTNYYETFTASDANLDWALGIEADRMLNSFIRKEDLATEMPVVRNEFEIGENDPTNILTERIISTMYLWHNYGKATIGARSDIENVPIPRLQAFYRNHYQPDNAVLTVAGRIDEAKTLAMISKHFGRIAKPARKLQNLYTQEPVQDGERVVKLERVGDIQAVMAGFHVPSLAHADYALTVLLTDVLANTPSGRLHKALVETKMATSVSSYSQEYRDPSALLLWAELRKEHSLDEARALFVKTLEGFAANPVTAEEVERARSKQLKYIDLTMNNSVNLAMQLSEAIGAGDWRLFFLNRDRLRNATAGDVQRVALTYLKPSNRTLGVFVPMQKPDRIEVPVVADVGGVLQDYKGEPPIAKGEAFDPTPEVIEKRVKRTELPGGMKMALLAKKTRGETVSAQLVFRYGDENNLKGQRTNAQMVGGLLMRGTKGKSREQLREAIDNLKASIAVGATPTRAYANITAKRDTLVPALKLVAEMLRESTLPEKEFDLHKQELLAELEAAQSDPASLADEAVGLHFNIYPPDDVRASVSLKDSVARVKAAKLDDAKVFYRDFFGSNNAQIAIVGDFDEKVINAVLPELFGNWKSGKNFKRVTEEFRAIPAAVRAIETPDKESATFIARANVNLSEDDPDYAALMLADWMLGGGADFAARLVARIRVKEGLSYAVYSSLDINSLDPAGSWSASAQFAPQNKAKVETAFRDEMARIANEGFLAAEVAAAKSGYAQVQQLSRSNDARLAAALATHLFVGRTFAWNAALDKKVQVLKPADVQAAMKRHLDLANFTIVNAGDFAKSTGK